MIKLTAIGAALAMLLLLSGDLSTLRAAGCGIPPPAPIPPIGCSAMVPQCVCDAKGNCSWTFVCVPE